VTIARIVAALALAAAACGAAAQQLYRWTDENGRVHVTDTPPPASAKEKRVVKPAGAAAKAAPAKPGAASYSLDLAKKQHPVTLYTSPNCTEPCGLARDMLNQRGVPFREVQVWEQEGNDELKRLSGRNQVPTLKVGTSVYSGFERSAYDGMLDSAGYPSAGVLPVGTQAAPGRPEGYISPAEREKPNAEVAKPEPAAAFGPYAPGASPRRAQKNSY
jgi:glutaredoxin